MKIEFSEYDEFFIDNFVLNFVVCSLKIYNHRGDIKISTNTNSKFSIFTYDEFGNKLTCTCDNYWQIITRDVNGCVLTISDSDGRSCRYIRDSFGVDIGYEEPIGVPRKVRYYGI